MNVIGNALALQMVIGFLPTSVVLLLRLLCSRVNDLADVAIKKHLAKRADLNDCDESGQDLEIDLDDGLVDDGLGLVIDADLETGDANDESGDHRDVRFATDSMEASSNAFVGGAQQPVQQPIFPVCSANPLV